LESSWFGLWYAAGAKPVCMILGLVIGVTPVSLRSRCVVMLRCCIGLGAFLLSSNHKSTHHCCNATQKMKSSLMKTSSRCAGPWSSTCGVVLSSSA
jgi:hypothetical protein